MELVYGQPLMITRVYEDLAQHCMLKLIFFNNILFTELFWRWAVMLCLCSYKSSLYRWYISCQHQRCH